MRNLSGCFTLLVAVSLASATEAQSVSEAEVRCKNESGQHSYADQVRECTNIIQSGQLSGPELARIYLRRGTAHGRSGSYDQAIADFDQVILLKPTSAAAYFNRGRAYGLKKNYDLAIADFNRGLQISPQDAQGYYQRGNLLLEMGRTQEGEADLTKAKSLGLNAVAK